MDSHVTGPRGRGYGAVVSANGVSRVFSDTAETGKEIFRTTGASPTNPLLVRITGLIKTAFDGDDPSFSLTETDLDGSNGDATEIADFDTGAFAAIKILTVDKIYTLIFDSDESTEGEAAYFIEICGPGQLS